MGVTMKKKYEAGEATWYMTRNESLRRLQLTLRDFRKLCILKGIYPREPLKRVRAQKGSNEKKTLYYKKDVQFLLHEPLIWKIWAYKSYKKRLAKAHGKNDMDMLERVKNSRPTYKLDQIIKERYPTFVDALRDLDDALSLTSLFAIMPRVSKVPLSMISLCRRLTIEFMHYVIEARAVRKVFISIKGIYYQADIQGQTVIWIVPHQFVYAHPHNVDFKIMATFVEIYTMLLGFVNFRLYHNLNMHYPPGLHSNVAEDGEELAVHSERVASLNTPLRPVGFTLTDDDPTPDEFSMTDNPAEVEKAKQEAEAVKQLQQLFSGLKFFLSREVPRESLVFVIRSVGGMVSWNKTMFVGATYSEEDESITHQIVDRPEENIASKFTSRYYLQPQWVYDCINARQVLPVQNYFPGAILPPHLSPFKEEDVEWGEYVPPEKLNSLHAVEEESSASFKNKEEEEASEEEEKSSEEEEEENDEKGEEIEEEGDEEYIEKISKEKQRPDNTTEKSKGMSVTAGSIDAPISSQAEEEMSKEEFWLRARMVKSKHRHKFYKLVRRKKLMEKEASLLRKKREMIDMEQKGMKKERLKAGQVNT